MNNITPYSRKVFYYETDKMKIVHHSNYIRMFEETRVDFLEKAGMPFEKIESLGIMMPVLSVECRYISPLRFDEPFEVYPKIERFNGVRLQLSYEVRSLAGGKVCATGTSSHCFTDNSMKPLRIKNSHPEIYELFKSYEGVDFTQDKA